MACGEVIVCAKALRVQASSFFLPHARPVPVKVGLELNRSAVGKTAISLVYPRPQQLTPSGHPAIRPGSIPPLNQAVCRPNLQLGHAWRRVGPFLAA